jgi:predicted DNA-binding protein
MAGCPQLAASLRPAVPDLGCRTCYLHRVRKTSVYLNERESRPLVELTRAEGRSQAEIIREAIAAYVPASRADGEFALAAGVARRDDDPRPTSEIPEDELLDGFGQ